MVGDEPVDARRAHVVRRIACAEAKRAQCRPVNAARAGAPGARAARAPTAPDPIPEATAGPVLQLPDKSTYNLPEYLDSTVPSQSNQEPYTPTASSPRSAAPIPSRRAFPIGLSASIGLQGRRTGAP